MPRHQIGTKRRVPWPVVRAQRPGRGRCGVPGEQLRAAIELLDVACRADRLIGQNLGLALGYNLVTVSLAVLGLARP